MSEPVTNVEIEDVLTSIRRLVSESGRGAPSAQLRTEPPEQARPKPAVSAPDRLMLTPALRVSDPIIENRQEDMGSLPPAHQAPRVGSSDWGQAAGGGVSAEFEAISDTEESEDFEDNVVTSFQAPHIQEADDDFPEFVEPDLVAETDGFEPEDDADFDADHDGDDIEDFDPDDGIALSEAQSLDSRIVQWENVSAGEDQPLEPDAPGDSDYAGTEVGALSWIEAVAKAQHEKGEATDRETGLESEPEIGETHGVFDLSGAEVEEQDAEPEKVVTEFANRIEAEAQDYAADVIEHAIAPELESFETEEPVMLDEALLREMVSDIVRQELQGALGERITRNVRKLVRREIHRALAAHDLE